MKKFQNKYRIESTRLQNWDYGSNAAYFITICTKDREYFFGNIINKKMQLSEIGKMANKYWNEIPKHFPFVKLDAFVVMPNHVHGIIIIDKPDVDTDNVETQNFASLHQPKQQSQIKNKFGPQSKNLASIIRGYKIGVTKNAKKVDENWSWQPRYHDHIIRNNISFERIRIYIHQNPIKWNEDKFNNKTK